MDKHRQRQIAVIIDATKAYDRKIIGGIGTYAQRRGDWNLYVEENPAQKLSAIRTHGWDGIIANCDDPRVAHLVTRMEVPVVGVGGKYGWYDPRSGIPYVATDDVAIARLAAEHLLDRGFTHFAFCGFARTKVNGWSEARGRALGELVAKAGFSCEVFNSGRATPRNWNRLQEELAAWLKGLPKPVGLLACNDARARHVLEACQRIGVRVPEDIAVVSVDDDAVLCDLSWPPLTSIDQGAHRVGLKAAALLDRLMAGRKPKGKSVFYVKPKGLVARRSTDMVAIPDSDVANAVRFIADHACRGIQVEHVLRAVTVSRATLERRFQEFLGRSVHDEIQRVRMERARKLVADTSVPLKQVAVMVGVKQLSYFTALFRQHVGTTPAKYRRTQRQ